VIEAGAQALPFPDASFDTVVATLVLCTVPDPEAAVAELRRVLRPGGALLFVEHVRAAEPRAARRQRRWARPWATVAAGCRCDRDTLALLRRHLDVTGLSRHRWRGMPAIVQPLIAGRAVA
jgi:ubiquinone/menaquinone biosynthesis C-methylase UbiE